LGNNTIFLDWEEAFYRPLLYKDEKSWYEATPDTKGMKFLK
jgi:hypothetical protein